MTQLRSTAPEATAARLTGAHAVASVVVSDATSLAVLGLNGRQLRALIVERAVPHARWRRHVSARVDHLLQALGLADAAPCPTQPWDEEAAIAAAVKPRKRRT